MNSEYREITPTVRNILLVSDNYKTLVPDNCNLDKNCEICAGYISGVKRIVTLAIKECIQPSLFFSFFHKKLRSLDEYPDLLLEIAHVWKGKEELFAIYNELLYLVLVLVCLFLMSQLNIAPVLFLFPHLIRKQIFYLPAKSPLFSNYNVSFSIEERGDGASIFFFLTDEVLDNLDSDIFVNFMCLYFHCKPAITSNLGSRGVIMRFRKRQVSNEFVCDLRDCIQSGFFAFCDEKNSRE